MTDRQVTHSDRLENGDIIGLCWKLGDGLEYITREDAIADIVAGTHRYFVSQVTPAVWVLARPASDPTYLTTEADGQPENNLDNLPTCLPR